MALATGPIDPQKTEVPFEVNTNPLAPSDELATIPPLKKVLPVNVVFAEVVNNVNTPVLAVTAPIPRGACHVAPCKAAELAVLATLNCDSCLPLNLNALFAVSANTALATDSCDSCLPLNLKALFAVVAKTAFADVATLS